jgi:DNA-binding transcriptional regulator YhcF (GntR family)
VVGTIAINPNTVLKAYRELGPLQWIESGLMLLVTAMRTGLCFRWVRRRLT